MSDLKNVESILDDLTRRVREFHNGDIVCIGYHPDFREGRKWTARTAFTFATAHCAGTLFEALDLLEQEIRDQEYNRMDAAQ